MRARFAIPPSFFPVSLSLSLSFLLCRGDREARKFVQQVRLGRAARLLPREWSGFQHAGFRRASRVFASFEICRALIQCRAGRRRHLGMPLSQEQVGIADCR